MSTTMLQGIFLRNGIANISPPTSRMLRHSVMLANHDEDDDYPGAANYPILKMGVISYSSNTGPEHEDINPDGSTSTIATGTMNTRSPSSRNSVRGLRSISSIPIRFGLDSVPPSDG